MEQRRVYLVGFMGAGKTTTGRLLAKQLGWKFIDLDHEIVRGERRSIAEIFRTDGEVYFRGLEREYFQQVSSHTDIVLALGGGAFAEEETRQIALSTGLTVWLKVSFASVISRVKMDGTRPKLGTKKQTANLYRTRQPLYGLAHLHIETENQTPKAVSAQILEVIRSR